LLTHFPEIRRGGLEERDPDETTRTFDVVAYFLLRDIGNLPAVLVGDTVN
jgi:hypothetical protein